LKIKLCSEIEKEQEAGAEAKPENDGFGEALQKISETVSHLKAL